MKAIETLNQKFNSLQRLKPKQKRLVRLGCAALALTLAVGAVPFIRSLAAGKTAVSDTDFVSGSDAATADNAVIMNGGTVEPKRYNALGGMEWVLANSLDELNHAALQSKSNIVLSDVTNWIESYLPEFMEQNGYDSSQIIYFVNDCTSSMIDYSYKHPQYGMQSVGTPLSRFDFDSSIVYYIPRVPSTSVTLSHTRMDLNVGDTETMTGELIPANTNDKIVWSSSDTTVATINNDGTVTAVGCGSTTITAKVYNDVYEIPVTVSGHPYMDPYELATGDWVKATSWEDLTNAAYLGRESVSTWRSRNNRKTVGGVPVRTAKLVYAYDPADGGTAYYMASSSGNVTEETFDPSVAVFYIPKPATSYTYHPAEPATCSEHATFSYWTDQNGNKFSDAKGENPIDSIIDENSPLGEHVWGEWVVTREPTCGESGEKTHTCTACGTSETEAVDPDPTKHSLTKHESVPATCTAAGTKEYWECSFCHKQYGDEAGIQELTDLTIRPLGHNWGGDTWNWASDYSSASVTLTCGRCHEEKTLTDNAPHIGTVVSEPTCTENKVVRYVANVQDNEDDSIFYSATSDDVAVENTALGHTWEWVTDTDPTCADPGEKHEECFVCHEKRSEHTEVAASGHTWGWITDTEPACETPGEKHEECSVCHEKRNEHTEIAAIGHDWGYWSTTTPATCAAPGEKTRTCKNDSSHTETEEIPALNHNWYAWTQKQDYPGMIERDCADCHTHEERIAYDLEFLVTGGDGQTYTKGSKQPLTIKFDKQYWPDLKKVNVYEMFTSNDGTVNVTAPDGTVTTLGAGDFTPSEGSLNVTLAAEYLEGLEDGNYSLTVTFVVAPDYPKTSAPATFTIGSPAPAGSDSPDTGESVMAMTFAVVLMTLAVCGCAFVFFRKRRTQA